MSNTVEGVVEKVSEMKAPVGSAKVWTKKGLLVNGDWYNAFVSKENQAILGSVSQGDAVRITTEQNGKYVNVTNVERMGAAQAAASPQVVKSASVASEKDYRITYLASRRDALALVTSLLPLDVLPLPAKKADKVDAIIGYISYYADKFAATAMNAKLKDTEEENNNNDDSSEGME